MPYLKIKQGNKICIYKKGANGKKTGGTLGCHPTEEKADQQLAALNTNVVEGMMKQKEIEAQAESVPEPIETESEEVYRSWDMVAKADVPYGATSFADVAAAREATQLMERLEKTTAVFYSLFWNIWRDFEIPMEEKTAAWKALFDDFAGAFESEMGAEESAMAELDDLAEIDTGSIVRISESDKSNADMRAPLKMDVVVIEPGWGNPKDGHYYPAEVVRRDAHIFEGAKMYATDHRPEEKSVRTEVAKVEKIISFSESGAPIARVKVWNPDFAEDIRNRNKLNELGTLKCSILAKGRAKKGQIDGKDANIVEAIIASAHTNVDFVTNAGAGGRALQLVELEKEAPMPVEEETQVDEETTAEKMQEAEEVTLHEQDEESAEANEESTEEIESTEGETEDEEISEDEKDEPTFLAETAVSAALDNSKLPEISRNRLAKTQYITEAELATAIQAEADYIQLLIGSGEPKYLGETSAVKDTPLTDAELLEDHCKRVDAIINS